MFHAGKLNVVIFSDFSGLKYIITHYVINIHI